MPTQDKTYSVFISTKPYGSDSLEFVYLCSDVSFSYSLSYSGTTTGIIGQGPDKAIFVDGPAGAVGSISISGTRCNPSTSQTTHNVNAGGDFITLSNAQIYNKMRGMLTANQMFQGAYVLRIYDVDWNNVTPRTEYRDLYIHIAKWEMTVDWNATSDARISLSGFRRYKNKGFGDE